MIDVYNWDENTRCSLSPLVCLWQKYTGLKIPCFPVASAEEVAGALRSASLCFALKASKEINDQGVLSVQPPARWANFWPYWSGSFRLKCLQPGVDLLGFLCEPGHHGTESGGISGCRGCSSVHLPVTLTIFFYPVSQSFNHPFEEKNGNLERQFWCSEALSHPSVLFIARLSCWALLLPLRSFVVVFTTLSKKYYIFLM